ncbi:hypothetical protein FXO38_02098 [Capsicum annuum]|nr:hypothetical protein FXO37_36492 [Capsicum annuum]KAF3680833.1 hypothetical protein FXO38_02098 [Capsicum annuum]
MSSWFSLPLLNPFKSDDGAASTIVVDSGEKPSDFDPNSSSIKEDLSVISQTFTRHLRAAAAFLTPPSSPPPPPTQSEKQSKKFSGIKSNLVEIRDRLKLSVSEIT